MNGDKTKSMLGFAVKSGKIIYGMDRILESRKAIHLIVVCDSISIKSLSSLKRAALDKKCSVLITKEKLEDILYKTNCKAVALTDKNMSMNIVQNANENYRLIRVEEI